MRPSWTATSRGASSPDAGSSTMPPAMSRSTVMVPSLEALFQGAASSQHSKPLALLARRPLCHPRPRDAQVADGRIHLPGKQLQAAQHLLGGHEPAATQQYQVADAEPFVE